MWRRKKCTTLHSKESLGDIKGNDLRFAVKLQRLVSAIGGKGKTIHSKSLMTNTYYLFCMTLCMSKYLRIFKLITDFITLLIIGRSEICYHLLEFFLYIFFTFFFISVSAAISIFHCFYEKFLTFLIYIVYIPISYIHYVFPFISAR